MRPSLAVHFLPPRSCAIGPFDGEQRAAFLVPRPRDARTGTALTLWHAPDALRRALFDRSLASSIVLVCGTLCPRRLDAGREREVDIGSSVRKRLHR